MANEDGIFCYGCIDLRSRWLGDGTTLWTCNKTPGLVVGEEDGFDDDPPLRYEDYRER